MGVAFWQGLYLAAAAGVAVLLAAPLSGWAFRVMGASAEVQAIATDYTEVRLGAAVGLMIFLVAENYYRGLGRTEVPMFAGLIQLALNCGLNYLLIFGVWGFPELGAAGTAVGTVIAQFLVALGLLAGVLGTKIGRDYGATRLRRRSRPCSARCSVSACRSAFRCSWRWEESASSRPSLRTWATRRWRRRTP